MCAAAPLLVVAAVSCSAKEDAPGATDAVDASSGADATTTADAAADGSAETGGGTGDDAIAEHSGARIKLSFETAADGFRRRVGLYDAQLDVACAPSAAADGASRCLPQPPASAALFTDAACTHRIARLGDCVPKPKYATAVSSVACGAATTTVFEMGAPVTPTQLYVAGPSGCSATTGPATGDTFYDVTEVPAATFAALDARTHALVPGLEAATFETADGLRVLSRLVDLAHGPITCDFFHTTDGQLRCVPQLGIAGVLLSLFSDGNCQNPIATRNCPDYSVAARYVTACPPHLELYSVGAPLDADAGVFHQSGATCSPAGAATNARPVTGSIAPSEFVLGTVVSSPSTARLRVDPIEVAPNVRLGSASFFPSLPIRDSAKNVECVPYPASDGKTRCLPRTSAFAEAFADDQCTTRVARVFSSSCGVPAFAIRLDVSRPTCAASAYRIYSVAAKRATTVAYIRDDSTNGNCLLQDLGATADVYDLGPEIAATEFVEVTTAHD